MNPEKKKEVVLVTGAAGSVGRYVLEELLKSDYKIVATDKREINSLESSENVEIKIGDLKSLHFLEEIVQGVDHIIHTAADIDINLRGRMTFDINFEATKNLFERATKAGVKRFIHLSTASVYQSSPFLITEEMPLEPGNDYERAKLKAEEFLRSQPKDSLPIWTILRPSLIYGPRGRRLAATFLCIPPIFRYFSPLVPGLRGGPRSNFVHALDVARAAVFMLSKPESYRQIYNVADRDPLSLGDRLSIVIDSYGLRKGPRLPFSAVLFKFFFPLINRELLFDILNFFLRKGWDLVVSRYALQDEVIPRIDRESLVYGKQDSIFSVEKLVSLGFEFRFPYFTEGWRDTLRWYQRERWAPTY
jgi:nucleoside-diphosphate-sugar epimerase